MRYKETYKMVDAITIKTWKAQVHNRTGLRLHTCAKEGIMRYKETYKMVDAITIKTWKAQVHNRTGLRLHTCAKEGIRYPNANNNTIAYGRIKIYRPL